MDVTLNRPYDGQTLDVTVTDEIDESKTVRGRVVIRKHPNAKDILNPHNWQMIQNEVRGYKRLDILISEIISSQKLPLLLKRL